MTGTGTPRWVKLFGIVAIALVVLFAVAQLTGFGGNHGPGRHLSPGGLGRDAGATVSGRLLSGSASS